MKVKGHNCDAAWFTMVDHQWTDLMKPLMSGFLHVTLMIKALKKKNLVIERLSKNKLRSMFHNALNKSELLFQNYVN